jgi:hypothetical protein
MTIKINLERDKLFDALGLQRLRESLHDGGRG